MLKPPNDQLTRLVAARALIDEPEKWCQGQPITIEGRRCLIGALWSELGWTTGNNDANYNTVETDSLASVVAATIERMFPHKAGEPGKPTMWIWGFNDFIGTEHADILHLLDELIATVE